MSASVARVGDAISHGGTILDGSPDVFANDLKVAREGDPVLCLVHGQVQIAEGSGNVFANDLPVARVGDMTTCGARITEGSPDVFAGD